MKFIESIKKLFLSKTAMIFLLIVLAAAAAFGGLSLMGKEKTQTAEADTALTDAEIRSIGYVSYTYKFEVGSHTFYNDYGVGSQGYNAPMLYHTPPKALFLKVYLKV